MPGCSRSNLGQLVAYSGNWVEAASVLSLALSCNLAFVSWNWVEWDVLLICPAYSETIVLDYSWGRREPHLCDRIYSEKNFCHTDLEKRMGMSHVSNATDAWCSYRDVLGFLEWNFIYFLYVTMVSYRNFFYCNVH